MRLLKKSLTGLWLYAVCAGVTSTVMAQGEEVTVKLEQLEVIQPQEKRGDELYFNITEFPQGELPSHYQIPRYPAHWLSKYINNVHNVVLWNKTLPTCKNVDVVISLVEEDFTPWDLDDELGSVKFKITCEEDKIKTGWTIPNSKDTEKLLPNENAFSFTGNESKYRAVFKIEEVPSKEDAKTVKDKEKALIQERKRDINIKIPMSF